VSFVRKQLLVYVAIGIVVVAIGARFLFAGGGEPDADGGGEGIVLAAEASPPAAGGAGTAASSAAASPSAPAQVVVDVAGAVARPGVYTLQAGARVCDALDLAGGTTAQAQTAAVNLAARLVDGQQIVIPQKGQTPTTGPEQPGDAGGGGSAGAGTVAGAPGVPVNLNTATLEQLDALSGVGPSTAQKIIDYREEHGGFRGVDELKEVSGIGDAKFAALEDQVTI
jgi:competence protein ComEA